MNQSATAILEMQPAEAASVIVHHVPEALTDKFLSWQRGITAAAQQFAGYLRTDVYPPAEGRQAEWVIVVHFENHAALNDWLESPQRSRWIGELTTELGDFTVKTLPKGFGPWFADAEPLPADHAPDERLPPNWKMALVVLLALYPTVMLLTLLVTPWLAGLGLAVSMLIGNALSVAFLQWGIMPRLTAVLRRWLVAPSHQAVALNVGGTLAIVAVLAFLVGLFQWCATFG